MGTRTVVGVVAILVVLAWYLSYLATRLDRLHARVEGARATLDAQLVRRASAALELSTSGLLDPASGMLLAGPAMEAREAADADRELAESQLSGALRGVLDLEIVTALEGDAAGSVLVADLAASCQRVEMARRFLNDAVRATRAVRRQRVVRLFRLAGHAAWPPTFEMDDATPPALARRPSTVRGGTAP